MAASGTGGSLVVLVMVVILAESSLQAHVEGKQQRRFKRIIDLSDVTDGKPDQLLPRTAKLGQFPWQVYIHIQGKLENGQLKTGGCGGSIINKQWVLTAAHCLAIKKDRSYYVFATRIEIHAGFIEFQKKDEAQKRTLFENDIVGENANHVFINNKFNSKVDYDNDIALIRLKKPLFFNDKVQSIDLATTDDIKPKKMLQASGWGCMSNLPANNNFPVELRFVTDLVLQSRDWCKENTKGEFTEDMICQRTKKKALCQGDSGGAVITGTDSSNGPPYVQIGIVSFTDLRMEGEIPDPKQWPLPTTLTNVAVFRDWIEGHMTSFDVCPVNDECESNGECAPVLSSANNNHCLNGKCQNGVCQCYPGYTGTQCSEKETACREDRGFFTPTGSKQCFKLFESYVTWEEAQQTCTDNRLVLAHPWDAVGLRSYIVQRYGHWIFVWLGARDDESNKMRWESNGDVITSDNPLWYTVEPDVVQPQVHIGCLILLSQDVFWKKAPEEPFWDYSCTHNLFPLCEFFPEDPCKDRNCVNGKCHNGVCLCNSGYTGDSCSVKETGCPEGMFWFTPSSQCFMFLTDKGRSWDGANEICQAKGLVLARPFDPVALRSYLVTRYGDWVEAWIDGRGDGSHVKWQRDQQKITRDNPLWWPGAPWSRVTPNNCLLLRATEKWWKAHPDKPYYSYRCSGQLLTLCELASG